MTEDLSTRHEVVGSLFSRPTFAEEWEQYRLSDEQVQFYREHGQPMGGGFFRCYWILSKCLAEVRLKIEN